MHTDKVAATEKSKAVVSGGVERVVHHQPLEPLHVPINPATLVVGGGIAGIQSALEIADAGFPVYLVEREPSIGGHMSQFDKTFPTLDCSACILTPKMVSVGGHKNIKMFTWSEVTRVDGYVGNFTVTICKRARYVNERIMHRLRHLPGKMPKENRRRSVRSWIGLPQNRLHTLPPGSAKIPGHRSRELHVLPKRHVQSL